MWASSLRHITLLRQPATNSARTPEWVNLSNAFLINFAGLLLIGSALSLDFTDLSVF